VLHFKVLKGVTSISGQACADDIEIEIKDRSVLDRFTQRFARRLQECPGDLDLPARNANSFELSRYSETSTRCR
jgi:hypothetical protein